MSEPSATGRREFLSRAGASAGLVWLSSQWPAIVAAAEHAHQAVKSTTPVKFQVLTSDDMPGAREAGVVYFIDQALKTFASDSVAIYQKGLAELNSLAASKYPGVKQFADANKDQQQVLLHEISDEAKPHDVGGRRRPQTAMPTDFFQTVWQHTIFGFLVDPSAGGNRDFAGWKVIARDPAHSFAPPFGFYDKDYPGWQKAMEAEEKK